ncbi:non-functional NADPH-dependent codeinone reductase 2 [Ziziphus jujuba]|uniref:Non-functional NADPH-dependent codeinone reductase 2 n=1 Tax=Ziziphus jujuba TaxID=326968 RepID=A0A6P4AE97_ZIZJJ|nr:non-functional NADPH-dependent codeinone reductase 2 [Ziziphus jujuba]
MTAAGSECIPIVVLSSSVGHRGMPVLGFGTASFRSDSDLLKTAVLEAIKLGYRHFDTAAIYGSEQALGEAIAEALKQGLVGSRNELFITTKLWCSDAHPSLVIPALKKSLQNLQLEYLDLYLVHWPFSAKPGKLEYPIKEEDVMPLDYNSVWADMEESQRLGLTRSIGVSNFTMKKLQNLLSCAKIPPSVNQVEMNPTWQQKKLIDFCKTNNIIVTAYSPLGAKGTAWGSNNVMDNQVLDDIAKAHGKSVAQVSLRWIYQQGATSVPKSYSKDRLKENLDIFDWELTQEDLHKISQLPQKKVNLDALGDGTNPKFLEELWDGEI